MIHRTLPSVVPAATRLVAVAAVAAIVASVVAACGGATASPSPSGAPLASAASATAGPSGASTPGAASSPSIVPNSSNEPTSAPSASAGACAVEPQSGVLPSDRFTSVVITSGPDADLVTFGFGASSLPGPPAPPKGSLETAVPPYTQAGSGQVIPLTGQHALQIRFTGMSIMNDAGQPVYDGPAEYRPDLPAVRDLVLFDASEGVIGWYLGYDGGGCVALTRVGDTVTVRIAHG